MTAPVLHARHRHGIPAGDDALLSLPEAQPVIKRIAASVDMDYPRRAEHIRRVATIAVRAKLRPTNNYARPTLFLSPANTTGPADATIPSRNVGRAS